MDIENIGEFANYCQQRADDPGLPEVVELAANWTDLSSRLERQYGGHGQPKTEWIEEAYQHLTADGVALNQDQLLQVRSVVTRFWKHGKAFDDWFRSKVIIVEGQPSTEA